jgi:hypothetical protein
MIFIPQIEGSVPIRAPRQVFLDACGTFGRLVDRDQRRA